MRNSVSRIAPMLAAAAVSLGAIAGIENAAAGDPAGGGPNPFTVHEVLSGSTLTHSYVPASGGPTASEALTAPDDLTAFDGRLFVAFQNGLGAQGQASSDGNTASTVVELMPNGDPIAQWDVTGKVEGIAFDPSRGELLVTVNEDANSSFYTIDPGTEGSAAVVHYRYNEPLPHGGGTDAISVYRGAILVSASAPGTTGAAAPQATYPAVYAVSLDEASGTATVTPLFGDEANATVANSGATHGNEIALALTDPDSNGVVPREAAYGGDFMVTSQGDEQAIFVHDAGSPRQQLSVLNLSQAVDDTAWPTSAGGRLYATDATNDSIDTITGPFTPNGPVAIATPCGANSAPSTCPVPPSYPANFLASVDPSTGTVTALPVVGAAFSPQGGLLYVPRSFYRSGRGQRR